jgi:hypothetical protein
MLDPYAAVVVYDPGNERGFEKLDEPAYAVVAHNLLLADAVRLEARLRQQFNQPSHIVRHVNHHTEREPTECVVCQQLVEELLEDAATMRVAP